MIYLVDDLDRRAGAVNYAQLSAGITSTPSDTAEGNNSEISFYHTDIHQNYWRMEAIISVIQ